MNAPVDLSVVVPCHNEAGNLRALVEAIHLALTPLPLSYEIVVTDDASTDGSWAVLSELAGSDRRLRLQRFATNCGESAMNISSRCSGRSGC